MRFFIPLCLMVIFSQVYAAALNDFTLDNASVPASEIFHGGPPRDGIPALDLPRMESAEQASWLRDEDLVMGVSVAGEARAYPMRILVWHEIVNDEVGEMPVAVTFCPLCGSGVVFDRRLDGKVLNFGVSGLLYNSDMLLYDHDSESLWTQIPGEAISGPYRAKRLSRLSAMHTTWGAWKKSHPDSLVLSRNTGHERDYDFYPYQDYEKSFLLHFPVSKRDRRYHPKELVIGIADGRDAKVWPFAELMKSNQPVKDSFAGQPVIVYYDDTAQAAWIEDAEGNPMAATTLFWFAWYAFYPHTEVYQQ